MLEIVWEGFEVNCYSELSEKINVVWWQTTWLVISIAKMNNYFVFLAVNIFYCA